MFGTILHRMIFGELVRVFLLALVTLTGLFLLGGLVAEATQRGLSPTQVLLIIPLLVPNTLPYTIPATTLFAACVVYGRLSHDNEVTAVRAAGVHLGRLISPSVVLGLTTAGGTLALYHDFIPRTHQMLRTQVLGDVEDLIYGILKRQGCLKYQKIRYSMWVRQVQGRRLIDVIFKDRDDKGGYKLVAWAREANIRYLPDRNVIRLNMTYLSTYGDNNLFTGNANEPNPIEMPLPDDFLGTGYQRRPSDLTWDELQQRRSDILDEIRKAEDDAEDPMRRPDLIPPGTAPAIAEVMAAWYKNQVPVKWRERYALEVEQHVRPALAVGCLCFALIGGPVGIWFNRADYLSAFVSCFLPTVVVYYPLLLCGTNLAKDGRIPAAVGIWAADAAVGAAAVVLYWRLFRR